MKRFVLLLLAAGVTLAQGPKPTDFVPAELKVFLGLSDQQIADLLQAQQKQQQAEQDIWTQIDQKQTALNQLLAQNTTDAASVGQLMIDIDALQKRIPDVSKPSRNQALAVLTPDQVAKLKSLDDALKLQNAAYEAISLNLLDGPGFGAIAVLGGAPGFAVGGNKGGLPAGPAQILPWLPHNVPCSPVPAPGPGVSFRRPK